jgi:hypothetical protein
MPNPYQSPLSEQFYNQAHQSLSDERERARAAVQGPAVGLLVVSVICVALMALTLPFDLFFLLVAGGMQGRVGGLEVDETKVMQIVIRMIWGVALLAASAYCIYGAWQMKSLKNYTHARNAAVVAVIPCLGPCCVLGIPFGAWALGVLARPEVQARFES